MASRKEQESAKINAVDAMRQHQSTAILACLFGARVVGRRRGGGSAGDLYRGQAALYIYLLPITNFHAGDQSIKYMEIARALHSVIA